MSAALDSDVSTGPAGGGVARGYSVAGGAGCSVAQACMRQASLRYAVELRRTIAPKLVQVRFDAQYGVRFLQSWL